MKANAPEKIWIDPATDLPKLSGHIDKDSVEYIRKDAFIEKAYNWLENYAFVDDNKNVNLPTLLHDFLKDSRIFLIMEQYIPKSALLAEIERRIDYGTIY